MITVVSGLPRSGTSMMMRMLQAGGMPLLVDGIRGADPDNPEGYYEFERVKELSSDKGWLGDAEGKAVKVVSLLLYELPPDREYRVVFMERNMDEILASQARMLQRRSESSSGDDDAMRKHFDVHLRKVKAWLSKQKSMKVLYCGYGEVVADPARCALELRNFLGKELDTEAMIRAVNPALYRQRAGR